MGEQNDSSKSFNFEPLNLEVEDSKRNGKEWMLEVVDTGTKANENIESVNSVGGGIVHEGYGLGRFKKLLSEVGDVDIEEGIRGRVEEIVDVLLQQDTKTNYDSDLVRDKLKILERLANEDKKVEKKDDLLDE